MDGKSPTEQEQDLTLGGGLAVLHRAASRGSGKPAWLTEDTFVTAQALTPSAHGGFSEDHLQMKVKCLPLPHLKVSPPGSSFPVSISWWEPRRDKATTGGRRAQTCKAGIQAALHLAQGLLQTRELQGLSGQEDQIQLLKRHPSMS